MPANPMMAQPVRRPEQEEEPEPLPAPPAQSLSPPEPPVTKEAAPVPATKPRPRPKQADIETIASLDSASDATPDATPVNRVATAPKRAKPPVVQDPLPEAKPAAPVEATPSASNESNAAAENLDFPHTVRDTLQRVDQSWAAFRAAALRIPLRGLDERIGDDGWSRKQMLAHVAAWHDLTADRLVKLVNFGELAQLDRDTDRFNAAIARQAVGKTSGEVLKDLDATFNRLRRQVARMTDAQLESNDWFAAWVIGGNTYGHYEEHWADISTSEPARR